MLFIVLQTWNCHLPRTRYTLIFPIKSEIINGSDINVDLHSCCICLFIIIIIVACVYLEYDFVTTTCKSDHL